MAINLPGNPAGLHVVPSGSTNQPPSVMNPEVVGEMLFNTMVLYGPTGSRKTSQIRDFARYVYEKTGKKTRLLTTDGGGYGTAQDYINAGIIDVWRLVEEKSPLTALTHASRGVWPARLINGIRQEDSYLRGKDSLQDVGAYAVEGWFSISQLLMGDLVGQGRKINEDVVSKWTEKSPAGDVSYGAPSRGHYGFVQRFLLDMIRDFSALSLERVLYTSLEGKGEDKLTKALTYGPATAGGAITAAIPQYVGDCIHFEDFQVDKGTDKDSGLKLKDTQVRAWFTSHPDPQTGVMWPAKCRIIPSKVEEFKKLMGESGYFNLNQKGLYEYLSAQDSLLTAGTQEIIEWKAKVDEARKRLAEGK